MQKYHVTSSTNAYKGTDTQMINLDETLNKLRGVLSVELEHTRVNGLTEITGHKLRRAAISKYRADIEAELEPIRQAANTLPSLPNEGEIGWAQAIVAMRLCSLKIDTTGLTPDDEIVRIAVVNGQEQTTLDLLVKPTRSLSGTASAANGLSDADLATAPTLPEVWEAIRDALSGSYVLVFSQGFDEKLLDAAAKRHTLLPLVFIGDSVQRHATYYYNREYSLTLEDLCQRMGHPLASKSAVDRALGQLAVVKGMASGITDVRPSRPSSSTPEGVPTTERNTNDDGLWDLDEHPF